jgi:hypothetical protein
MTRLSRSPLGRLLAGTLLVALLLSLPACGLLGGNDGDDQKFPEPPDRPNAAQVIDSPAPEAPGARAPSVFAAERA